MLFLYWLKKIGENIHKNYITEAFYDIGETIEIEGEKYEVIDYAVEGIVNCEELAEAW